MSGGVVQAMDFDATQEVGRAAKVLAASRTIAVVCGNLSAGRYRLLNYRSHWRPGWPRIRSGSELQLGVKPNNQGNIEKV